ncbi:MAG: RimK/LysX family protein [Candidatus Woesearchaeota archaeon]
MDRTVVGLEETIILSNKSRILSSKSEQGEVKARIDTGAERSSVDSKLAAKLKLGPVVMTRLIKSQHGNSVRPIVHAHVKIAGKDREADFTIADRTHMKYKVLIGQDILKKGFLVDPMKK